MRSSFKSFCIAGTAPGTCCGLVSCNQSEPENKRPNIIVILADDLGFSDIGCYGGEIHTPVLDSMAQAGLRYTQFYNTARSCPSRACLLTGLNPHLAGVEQMDEGIGRIMTRLRSNGLQDNTLVFFLSDNGASSEGHLYKGLVSEEVFCR